MVCSHCQATTNGIKINGKLFCSNCGEVLEIEINDKEIPEISTDQISDINSDLPEIDLLNAEAQVLDLIEEETLPEEARVTEGKNVTKEKMAKKEKAVKIKDKSIKKHNRPKVFQKKEKDFVLLPGEPDPITVPELSFPKEDQLEEKTEKSMNEKLALITEDPKVNELQEEDEVQILDAEINYPFLEKEDNKELKEKGKRNQEILTSFFKNTAQNAAKKNRTKKKKKHPKLILVISGLVIFITFGLGLVLYINLYATKPEKALEKAEKRVAFSYKEPTYLPIGYELTYRTTASENSISYYYEYRPDKSINLIISISNNHGLNDIAKEQLTDDDKSYLEVTVKGETVWIIEEKKAVFKRDNILYEITATKEMKDELKKIAEGMI